MANASYLKIFAFTFSQHLVGRKIPDSVSNYLPSCLSKFDSLSLTFNFVLSKLNMLSCVFVLNLLRKRQHLIELKLLDSLRCGCLYLLNIWFTMQFTGFPSNDVLEDFGLARFIYMDVEESFKFALKGSTISKRLKPCLHREYFVKISFPCRY